MTRIQALRDARKKVAAMSQAKRDDLLAKGLDIIYHPSRYSLVRLALSLAEQRDNLLAENALLRHCNITVNRHYDDALKTIASLRKPLQKRASRKKSL